MKDLSHCGIGPWTVLALVPYFPLDRVPDHPRGIAAVELVDGDDPGWRGHVDLGQPLAADDVDADEQPPAPLELRAERYADLALGIGQLGGFRRSAGGQVGADVALLGPAVDGAGEFAVDQHD